MSNITKKYFLRAKIIAGLLAICPFVRAVFLNGSVSQGKAMEKSDIDFFIIVRKNRLYSGRFFVTGLVCLTGLRRYGNKIAGRICLNRYQTDDYLIISPQDKKNAHHHSFTIILWARDDIGKRFISANVWMKKFGFNIKTQKKLCSSQFFLWPLFLLQFIFELFFDLIFHDFGEKILKKYQEEKILNNPLTKKAAKGQIYISDTELRFHPKKRLDKTGVLP